MLNRTDSLSEDISTIHSCQAIESLRCLRVDIDPSHGWQQIWFHPTVFTSSFLWMSLSDEPKSIDNFPENFILISSFHTDITFLAQHQSWILYTQTGFRIFLYTSSLLTGDKHTFPVRSQCNIHFFSFIFYKLLILRSDFIFNIMYMFLIIPNRSDLILNWYGNLKGTFSFVIFQYLTFLFLLHFNTWFELSHSNFKIVCLSLVRILWFYILVAENR